MTQIRNNIIPHAIEVLQKQRESIDVVKKEIAELRLSMKRQAEEIKAAVDAILTDSHAQVDKIEKSVIDVMEEKRKETEDYVSSLKKLAGNLDVGMTSAKPTELISLHEELTKIKTTSSFENSQPKLPVFLKGKVNNIDLEIQFGELFFNDDLKVGSASSFSKAGIPDLHLGESLIKTEAITLSNLEKVYHLSFSTSGHFLASDNAGNLIEFDRQGYQLQEIPSSKSNTGYHTGAADGGWLYTDYNKMAAYRVKKDMATTELIPFTGAWTPESIYSSHSSGNILMGMNKHKEWKVTRYSREGKELQDIQWGDEGEALYRSINYIAENINGDICTSDLIAYRVVVVTRSGQYRFSYSGHRSQTKFWPFGICTDVLGNILVCNGFFEMFDDGSSVHLLGQDGQFLSLLLPPKLCPQRPRALCVDNQHHLWVGCQTNSTVSVYRYLHKKDSQDK
jgi:hypothetical protein